MEDKKTSLGLTYGLMGGMATIVLMLLVYIIDHTAVTSFPVLMMEVVVSVIFMVLAAWSQRSSNHDYITFRPALKTTYGTAVLTWLVFCVFYYSLYAFIDPDLIKVFFKHAAENITAQGHQMGKTDQEIASDIARYQQSGLRFDSARTMFFLYLFLVILSFFYAAIISAILTIASKNNNPAPLVSDQNQDIN